MDFAFIYKSMNRFAAVFHNIPKAFAHYGFVCRIVRFRVRAFFAHAYIVWDPWLGSIAEKRFDDTVMAFK